VSGLDDIKSKFLKSKYYAGQCIGNHTLVAPRGNPDLAHPLFWDRRCGNCGAVVSVQTSSIPALKGVLGCKECKLGRIRNAQVDGT
jgi:hypothetical protein